tara:strand:- start:2392 stop:2970 length:579 start_codon:yes stop_codon:yes gene_type:complete
MKTKLVKISELKGNESNPRIIKETKFKQLVQSIKDFPEMLKLRPIVVNEEMIILGGNMRFKACVEAGVKEVPITIAKGLTKEQQDEFIIKDNVGFGEWDWNILANEWDNRELKDWGMDVWQPEEAVDYSVLEGLDLDEEIEDLTKGVRKGILIDFDQDDYEEAVEWVGKYRKANVYIGGLLLTELKSRKLEE